MGRPNRLRGERCLRTSLLIPAVMFAISTFHPRTANGERWFEGDHHSFALMDEAGPTSSLERSAIVSAGRLSSTSVWTVGTSLGLPGAGVSRTGAITLISGFWSPLARPASGVTLAERVPTKFELHGVRPNPFRDRAEIHYAIPQIGRDEKGPRIRIFDVGGRLVADLEVDRTPGYHALIWDGTSRNGQRLSSGMYFLRMESAHFRANHRIVLIR